MSASPPPEQQITEDSSGRHGRWKITPGTLFAADLKTVVAIIAFLLMAVGTAVGHWQKLDARVSRVERDMLTRTDLLAAQIHCQPLATGDLVCRVMLESSKR